MMIPRDKILHFLNRYGNIIDKNDASSVFYQLNCNVEVFSLLLKGLEKMEIITVSNLNIIQTMNNEYYFPDALNELKICLTEKGKYLVTTFLIGKKSINDFGSNDLEYLQIDNAGFYLPAFENIDFDTFYESNKGILQRDARLVYYLLTGKKILTKPITVFVSYSWEESNHNKWVLSFAKKLKSLGGFNVIIDQLNFTSGMHSYESMRNAIMSADKVLTILTPNYKLKAETNNGGVGYESSIIRKDLFKLISNDKYIPILRKGERSDSTPNFMNDYFNFNDLRKRTNYTKLITEIKADCE